MREKENSPSCSVTNPCVSVTVPGTVTGIFSEQVLPVVVRVIAVMAFAVGSAEYVRMGLHASLFMRFRNDRAS